jgi:predicted AlkP superfamily phosphohydrolase/phosphomutase
MTREAQRLGKRRVLVLGLDSAPPELIFGDFGRDLPNLRRLIAGGAHGPLLSCDPPITVPAWMVMMTGKSPGKLGIYGFRHRVGNSYTEVRIATTAQVKEPTVWDIIGRTGRHVTVVAVPPSFPPRPVNGEQVGCMMTPDTSAEYTYPPALKQEIAEKVGDYTLDITFRHDDRDRVLGELFRMTETRFDLFEHLLKTRDWDFFIGHEIGLDRLHHTFWKYFDRGHHLYEPGNKYEQALPDYYRMLDARVGRILKLTDSDTSVLVVSDHGTQRMNGAFCINQWLAQKGYLAFKEPPKPGMQIEKAQVDWSRTRAWAWGGYYARVFFNVEGREPHGTIKPAEFEGVRDRLAADLKQVRGPGGQAWRTEVYKPSDLYEEAVGDTPDLLVYFDALTWRAAGTLGHQGNYLFENDTGPDDAVHSKHGIVIMSNCGVTGEIKGAKISDIAPTILRLFGLPVPSDMTGRPLA